MWNTSFVVPPKEKSVWICLEKRNKKSHKNMPCFQGNEKKNIWTEVQVTSLEKKIWDFIQLTRAFANGWLIDSDEDVRRSCTN